MRVEDIVPTNTPPLGEVVHHGKNTLPAFSHFAKVFCRPEPEQDSGELWGYNRNQALIETTVGPGYFVAYDYRDDEVLVDYLRTPPTKPDSWPPIVPNSKRLSRLVYYQTQDVLRTGVGACDDRSRHPQSEAHVGLVRPLPRRPAMKVLIADRLAPFVNARLVGMGRKSWSIPASTEMPSKSGSLKFAPKFSLFAAQSAGRHVEAASSLSLVIRAGAGVKHHRPTSRQSERGVCGQLPWEERQRGGRAHIGAPDQPGPPDFRWCQRSQSWAVAKEALLGRAGLRGRRLAVIGTGRIGREVIGHAKSLGMNVSAWSRNLTEADASRIGVSRHATLVDAVRDAQAVTVHLALTPETRGLINDEVFSAMPLGAYFINTSRGEVVDETALLRALDERDLVAGLDVFCDEPKGDRAVEGAHPLLVHPRVYGTHHIGASTQQASDAVAEEVVRITHAYREGMPLSTCVNLAEGTSATHFINVRHADEVGVLADVLRVLRDAGHNVQEISNSLFGGSTAACARIAVEGNPRARSSTKWLPDPTCSSRPRVLEVERSERYPA